MAREDIESGLSVLWSTTKDKLNVMFTELYNKVFALSVPSRPLPPDMSATNVARIEVTNDDEIAAHSGVMIRRNDSAVGLDLWQSGNGQVYIDHRHNSDVTALRFRFKSNSGSPVLGVKMTAVETEFYHDLALDNGISVKLDTQNLFSLPTYRHTTLQHSSDNTPTRFYLMPKGSIASGLAAGLKIFGTDYSVDSANYDDFGIYNADDGLYLNSKKNGTVAEKNIKFATDDVAHSTLTRDAKLGVGTTDPTSPIQAVGIPVYANNAAAIAGGLTVGAFYRTGADPDPLCIVH